MKRHPLLKEGFRVALFFVVIAAVFYIFGVITTPETLSVKPVNGKIDLTKANLSYSIASISEKDNLLFYPNALLTPDTVSKGIPGYFQNSVQYGTYRLILTLPAGKVYGLSMRSANFSQRTFINGVEQPAVGIVGSTPETTYPKTTYSTFYFFPQTENTEILIQYANFNHKTSGLNSSIFIGEAAAINRQNQIIVFKACIIAGCMLTIFLYYLGMFLFFGQKKQFLYFALCCLFIGIRTLQIDNKVLMVLLPNLNWYVSIALEYLCIVGAIITFVAFTNNMCPLLPKTKVAKVFRRAIYAVSALYALIILFTSPLFYSKILVGYQLFVALLFGFIYFQMLFYLEKYQLEHTLTLVGFGVFFMGAFYDVFYYAFGWRIFGFRLSVGFTQGTMMVFVFEDVNIS